MPDTVSSAAQPSPRFVPRPPLPPAAATDNTARSASGGGVDGGTVRNCAEFLATLNSQVEHSRDLKSESIRRQHYRLKALSARREQVTNQQMASRAERIAADLKALSASDETNYRIRHRLRDVQEARSRELKYAEMERRALFSERRRRLEEAQEGVASELRQEVFLTPAPNHASRTVSPEKMSAEVRDRLLPSPRRSDEPPHSKEVVQRLQMQRDEQVEAQRKIQAQQLEERKQRRQVHLEELRGRLDQIVKESREAQEKIVRKKQEEEARIQSWRWRKGHQLRTEAVERLAQEEEKRAAGKGQRRQGETEERTAPLPDADRPPYAEKTEQEPKGTDLATDGSARDERSPPRADAQTEQPLVAADDDAPVTLDEL